LLQRIEAIVFRGLRRGERLTGDLGGVVGH
jgi:hypothetical protein